MTKAIRCFSNVTLLPLPPYSPELNPVEQLWQQIKQKFLSNTTFQNYDDIIIKIYSNALAFSAVKPDGSIRTWGNPEFEALVHH
jgi:transposase